MVYSTFNSKIKAAHAERFIRTLKGRLYRAMNMANSWRWLELLPDATYAYNHAPHGAFKKKYTPDQVHHDNGLQMTVREMLYGPPEAKQIVVPRLKKTLFNAGDTVRISQSRSLHHRGYYPQNSVQLFKVKSADVVSGISTYRLEDLNQQAVPGIFYDQDLILSAEKEFYAIDQILKERGKGQKKEYFVSFIGYSPAFNAWIKKADLQDIKGK